MFPILCYLAVALVSLAFADIVTRHDIKQMKLNHEFELNAMSARAYYAGVAEASHSHTREIDLTDHQARLAVK